MAHENLDVNSDQVNNLAEPYQYAASDFSNLSGRIDEIWARYKDAWGHDSIGAAVAPSFEQGFQYLQGSAKALHETLHYYSDGLSRSGKVYGESEDNAAEGGRQLDSAFSQIQTPTFNMPAETSSSTPFKTARRMEALAPLAPEEEDLPRMRLASRIVRPGEVTEGRLVADDMPAEKVFMRSERRVAEPFEDSQPGEPLQPLMRAERVEGQVLQPRELAEGQPLERRELVEGQALPMERREAVESVPAQPLMRAERIEAQPAQPLMRAETVEGRLLEPAQYTPARPAIPAGAVIDPSIPPDSYGPWYRLPDGSILAHPAESARIPTDS